MKPSTFHQLKKKILENNLILNRLFVIDDFDLSDLDAAQWKILGALLVQRKALGLQLSGCKTHTFSEATWQALFQMIAKSSTITQFIIQQDPLPEYQNTTWHNLFKHLPPQIKKLGFSLCHLSDITLSDYPALLNGLISASHCEELDLSGNLLSFPALEKQSAYPSLIATLSKAPHLKRLLICVDSFWSEDNEFWQMPELNFTNTHLSFLGLDSTRLGNEDEFFWRQFCDKIANSQIISLSLGSNRFYNFTPESWHWFFEGLAKTKVIALDITEFHSLELNTEEKINAFFSELRHSRITTIHYITNNGDSSQFTPAQEKMLSEILEANKRKLLAASAGHYRPSMADQFAYNLRTSTKRQSLKRTVTDENSNDETADQNSPHNSVGAVAPKDDAPKKRK